MKDLKQVPAICAVSYLLNFKGKFTIKIQDGKILRVTGDFTIPPDLSRSICSHCRLKSEKRFCKAGLRMTEFKAFCEQYD